jgi:hypothetical protein
LASALLALLLIVALTPYLLSFAVVRNPLIRLATLQLRGSLEVGDASLGWFSPPRFEQITLRDTAGAPALEIQSIEGEYSLAGMLWHPRTIGVFHVREPQVHLVIGPGGNNLREIIGVPVTPETTPDEPPSPRLTLAERLARLPQLDVGIDVTGARIHVIDQPTGEKSVVGDVRIASGLGPDANDQCGLYVRPGDVLDHLQLTRELCNDVLKYIAPTLSRVSRAGGTFSLHFNEFNLPLANPAAGQLSGELVIHEVQVGGSPLIESLAAFLQLPPNLVVEPETTIAFQLIEGRIHHSPFTFNLGLLPIRTQGSVGFDDTLDLVAEVSMPTHWTGTGPLRDALSGQSLQIPIRGTLSQPVVDQQAIGQSASQLLLGTLRKLAKPSADETTPEALEQQLSAEGLLGPGGLVDSLLKARTEAGTPLLDRWLQRRAATPQPEPTSDQPQVEEAAPAEAQPPTDGPLRRLLRRRRGSL